MVELLEGFVGKRKRGGPARPRALVLTQYYHPEPNFITADVAGVLAATHDVTVVAGMPNYPSGTIMAGYSWWRPKRERLGAVSVIRVPYIPGRTRSVVGRFVSYVSFTISAAVAALGVGIRAQVVWVYQTPPTVGLVAVALRVVARSKIAFTYADLWPESFAAAGVTNSRWVSWLMIGLRRYLNAAADLIVGSTRGTVQTIVEEGASCRVVHIPVWVDGIPEECDEPPATEETRRIVYAGNIGAGQDLDCVVEVARRLEHRNDVWFDIIGTGSELPRLRRAVRDAGLENVRFSGRLSPADTFARCVSAAAQIVALKRGDAFARTVPSKLAFCCAAGAPVLYSLDGESAEIAAMSGGGIAFDGRDAGTLLSAVEHALEMTQAERVAARVALRRTYAEMFSRVTLMQRYEDEFRLLLGHASCAALPPSHAERERVHG
jgi:colanic acid biosynthesis glycosyl transferase WcaI